VHRFGVVALAHCRAMRLGRDTDTTPAAAAIHSRAAAWAAAMLAAAACAAPVAQAQEPPRPGDSEGWAAMRATAVATPAAGLPFAAALQRAGQPARAVQLRIGLLGAHIAALNGAAWPAPRTIGQVHDEAAGQPAPTAPSAMAEAWREAFNRHADLRWDGPAPAEVGRSPAAWRAIAPGAWTLAAGARTLASVTLGHRSPAPMTLPRWTLQLAGPQGSLFLVCEPLVGAIDAVAAGERRRFTCQADAADRHGLLARATRGRPAAGESVTLLPSHFESAAAWTALAEAVGSATPINTLTWVERLTAPAPPAVATTGMAGRPLPAAPASTSTGAPASTSAADTESTPSAAPPRPLPPAAWRTAFAVMGSFGLLLLTLRLVLGHLDEESPARTFWRTLPWLAGCLALAAVVGSPWGQATLEHASGAGLRNLAVRLQGVGGRAPAAWQLDALAVRYGAVVFAAGAGVLFFIVERALIVRGGFSSAYVKGLSLLARGAIFLAVAAAMGPPAATVLYIALVLLAGAMLVTSVLVSWLLHSLFEQLDEAGLGLFAALKRTVAGTLDFGGTATRAEFWAWPLFAVVVLLLVQAVHAAAVLPVAVMLVLPVPALLVRRLRGLDERVRARLLRRLARETVERAVKRRG